MKVGIDISRMNRLNKKRGIGYYAENLYKSLKEYTDIDVVLIEENRDEKVDLIHYPYFDFFNRTLPLVKKIPTVVTVHDVIPVKFANKYPAGIKGSIKKFIQRMALGDVKAVITDSIASKKDINKYLGVSERNIFPIYLAQASYFKYINDKNELKKTKEKYELPDKFVLYTGDVNWNKNMLNIAKACSEANIDLYMVGKGFEDKANLSHPEKRSYGDFLKEFENDPKIHMLGFVENEELVGLMNLATCLVLVSLYEGFGLPILEAQSCGLPVITSDISSMPEVAGDAALYADPESVEDIKSKIKKLFENDKEREALVRKGFENIKRFSWQKTAVETAKIYEQAVK